MDRVKSMVNERPLVIFSKTSCCLCHTIKMFFSEFGVNPTVYELDEIPRGKEIEQALSRQLVSKQTVPAVFITGELVGGLREVNSLHLKQSLMPMLREAGAIWSLENPMVYELDEIPRGKEIEQALARQLGSKPNVPAVFIGGELVGGLREVNSLHLKQALMPMIRKAGAIWV